MKRWVLSLAVLAAVFGGCGPTTPGGDGRPQVVATTTQVADLVRSVAGDRAAVKGILPPNADPHEYEPRPSDSRAVAGADLIIGSGGDVDSWLAQVIAAAGTHAPVLALIDHVKTITGTSGVDPHWWQNPQNAILAVDAIRGALTSADPAGRAEYRKNAEAYTAELQRLDRQIAACVDRLADDERNLVTEHDALGYYADRYGLQVIGAAIPALSTQAQPSAGDTARLVDQVRAAHVKAVFPEAGLNPKLQQAIASEGGAGVGGQLWADTLGPAGSSGATYVDSLRSNTQAIVEGLSGGAAGCGW